MNERFTDILKLARIQLVIIPIFVFFKLIRPSVLAGESLEIFKIALLSLPNFFEAIIGTLILTGLGLIINDKVKQERQIRPKTIYFFAVILAGIYVTTQELKIHNLGGNNVYDTNDLIFSFIGLLIGYSIIRWMQPTIKDSSKE